MTERPSYHIIVVGQIPPPLGGQSVMIKKMLDHPYQAAILHHAPMNFTKGMDGMGKVNAKKILEVVTVIFRVVKLKWKTRADVIYYPPSGPSLAPVLRDAVILTALRPLFKKTIFHFHASGSSLLVARLPNGLRSWVSRAFNQPLVGIRTTHSGINDSQYFRALQDTVVYCGVEVPTDPGGWSAPDHPGVGPVRLSYMSVVKESKGIFDLLSALSLLKAQGVSFSLQVAGEFDSAATQQRFDQQLQTDGLKEFVQVLGPLDGDAKRRFFLTTDVFCFPTFFEAESFGIVAIEAMSYGIPVVATRWRSLPEIVGDDAQGILIEPNAPSELAAAIARLANDEALRVRLGRGGAAKFRAQFSIEAFHHQMDTVFRQVGEM